MAEANEVTRAVKARRDKEQRKRAVDDLKWLMGDKRGRRIMYALLDRAGVYRSSFSTNATDMAFNEGQRNIGLFLTAQVHEHVPETYLLMLQEQKQDDTTRSNPDPASSAD